MHQSINNLIIGPAVNRRCCCCIKGSVESSIFKISQDVFAHVAPVLNTYNSLYIQIPGNKMTAANLAVIFGPNLLQRERGGDLSPHIYAMGIEDSTAIINVTLVLIQNHRRLFTVRSHTHTMFSGAAFLD